MPTDPVPWVGIVLLVLAGWMLVEAILVLLKSFSPRVPPSSDPVPSMAPA
jgi:hypothetical protein